MSKKETIEDKVRSLAEREKKIKLQLDNDSDEMKDKARRIGKIALTAGIVAILGYWIFNIIFQDDEDEEKPKKKKKKYKSSAGFSSRIGALAMPYINKLLEGILSEDDEEEDMKKSRKRMTEED